MHSCFLADAAAVDLASPTAHSAQSNATSVSGNAWAGLALKGSKALLVANADSALFGAVLRGGAC